MNTIASPQEFLTTAQAARRLKVTPTRVRQFREEGRFTGCIQIGPQWLIPAAEISRFAKLTRPAHRPKSNPTKAIKKRRKSSPQSR